MANHDEQFTSEDINEQIRRFSSASQTGADPNHRLIHDLRRACHDNEAEEDAHSLQRSWERIVSAQQHSGQHVQTTFKERKVIPLSTFTNEAGRTSPRRTFGQGFSILAIAAVALFLVGSMAFMFTLMRNHNTTVVGHTTTVVGHTTTVVSHKASTVATTQANIILTDALDHNSHNWLEGTYSDRTFMFENGAYHIANSSSDNLAIALLPDEDVPEPFTDTITMNEVKSGDVTNPDHFGFGLVLCFNQDDQNNQGFYSFEIKLTGNDAEYQFSKYDSRQSNPWTLLWHQPLRSEYHTGQGATNNNTVKVVANGNTFTFLINGKQVGSASDNSFQHGQIGMLVNQDGGTEIAFSNLILTHP